MHAIGLVAAASVLPLAIGFLMAKDGLNDGWTSSEETINGCLLRTRYLNGVAVDWILFDSSGWKIRNYRTERGARKAAERQAPPTDIEIRNADKRPEDREAHPGE